MKKSYSHSEEEKRRNYSCGSSKERMKAAVDEAKSQETLKYRELHNYGVSRKLLDERESKEK